MSIRVIIVDGGLLIQQWSERRPMGWVPVEVWPIEALPDCEAQEARSQAESTIVRVAGPTLALLSLVAGTGGKT